MTTAREDGRAVARLLRGSWRNDEPLLTVDDAELAALLPSLLDLGVAGLVWSRLPGAPLDATRTILRDAYRLQSLHALLHAEHVERAAVALAREGVDALIGKGWTMARQYSDAAVRPYGDIDVYVPEEQLDRARAALDRDDDHDDRPVVDLHASFAELRRAPAEVLARAQTARLGDATLRLFAPADHLLLLVAHFLRHGGCRPLSLCDIALVAEDPALDWNIVLAPPSLPFDWLAATLALARDLLGANLERAPLSIRAFRPPSWLARAIVTQWGRRDFVPQGVREPIIDVVRHPQKWVSALWERWPNAIEASANLGARFDEAPRLPLQLAECARRAVRFIIAPRQHR